MLTITEAKEELQLSNMKLTITNLKRQIESLLSEYQTVEWNTLDDSIRKILEKKINLICEAYFAFLLADYNRRTQTDSGSYLQMEDYNPFQGIEGTLYDKKVAMLHLESEQMELQKMIGLSREFNVDSSNDFAQIEKNNKLYYEMIAGLNPSSAAMILESMYRQTSFFPDLIPMILLGNYAIDYYLQTYEKKSLR